MPFLTSDHDSAPIYFPQYQQTHHLGGGSIMDEHNFPPSADIAINLIDPRLDSTMPNFDQMNRFLTEPHNSFFDAGQACVSPNPSNTQLYFNPHHAESYDRSTTPLSRVHSSMLGSDLDFRVGQGSPAPADINLLSPRSDPLHLQDNLMFTTSLIGLENPENTELGQESRDYDVHNHSHMFDCVQKQEEIAEPSYTLASKYPDVKHEIMAVEPIRGQLDASHHRYERQSPKKKSPGRKSRKDPSTTKRQRRPRRIVNSNLRPRPTSAPTAPINPETQRADSFSCNFCSETYKNRVILEEHVRVGHGRAFTCVFHYAGCDATFTSKNEWKRHINSQHLQITVYLCVHENCANFSRIPGNPPPGTESRGKLFNRKDLYDQHVKRMHTPAALRLKPTPQWAEKTKIMRQQARRERCTLPMQMACPAPRCTYQFTGDGAWDERTEHIAHHMEKAAEGVEQSISFGGVHDEMFSVWAALPGVDIVRRTSMGWELCAPVGRNNNARCPS